VTAAVRAGRGAALLVLVAAGGWLGARVTSGRGDSAGSTRPSPAPAARAFDSATVSLRGRLTPTAYATIRATAGGSAAILVVLDSADIRVCEDLGRQLRELRNRAGPAVPLVVVVEAAALVPMRAFARRERLRAGFVPLSPRNAMADGAQVPTPAALILRPGSAASVVGVAHPRRFPNVRVRSFADELSAYLPVIAGSTSPPETRRFP
jgi:hypothetical protein